MRPGLVAVGAAFLLVGVAVTVGLLNPGNDPTVERTGSAAVPMLPAGEWRPLCFAATASQAATLSLSWASTAPANVSLYAVGTPCPTATTTGPPLWSWSRALGGSDTATVAASSEYEIIVTAPGGGSAPLNFSASFDEHYRTGALTLPLVPFVVTMVGASMLTGMGAVALYLGLFLPSGVYGPLDAEPYPEGAAGSGRSDAPSPPAKPPG